MAGLRVVHALSVHQDEGLTECASPNGKIGLHAVGCPLAQIERRIEAQEIDQGVG